MFAFSPPRPALPADLVARLRPVSLSHTRRLPVEEPWGALVPGGALRRGWSVVVQSGPGLGGLSVALGLLTGLSRAGNWVAVVGVDDPGVVAMADLGLDLRRVLFVPRPRGAWAEAVSDVLGSIDVIVVRPPGHCAPSTARRLVDRVRERGALLVVLVEENAWPVPPDLNLVITQTRWVTTSRLEARYVTLRVSGRGAASQAREHMVVLPNRRGRAEAGD